MCSLRASPLQGETHTLGLALATLGRRLATVEKRQVSLCIALATDTISDCATVALLYVQVIESVAPMGSVIEWPHQFVKVGVTRSRPPLDVALIDQHCESF